MAHTGDTWVVTTEARRQSGHMRTGTTQLRCALLLRTLQCNVKDDMPRWMFLRGRVQGEVLQMSNFLLLLKSSLNQPTAESGFILDANRRIIMWHGRLSVISSEEEERDTRNSQ